MIQVILRNYRKRKIRLLANILMIAAGIILIYTTILLNLSVSKGIEINENRLGADYMIVPEGTKELIDDEELLLTGAPVCVYMKQELVDQISQIDGVKEANVQFFAQTINASCCSVSNASRIIGANFEHNSIIKAWLENQTASELTEDQVVVGAKIGGTNNRIEILGKEYQIAGRLEETGGAFDNSILMNINETRNIVKDNPQYDHFWERYGQPESLISSIQLKIDGQKRSGIAQELKEIDGIDIIAEAEVYQNVNRQVDTLTGVLAGISMLIILITMVQLFAEFLNYALTRKSEWALLRAVGLNNRRLKGIIFGEAFVQILLGGIVGFCGSFVWFKYLLGVVGKNQVIPFVMPSMLVRCGIWAGIFMCYVLFAVIASSYPMWKSGKLDLAVTMMKGDID